MPNPASSVLILAEDQEHQKLIWDFLKRCNAYKNKMGVVQKLPPSAGRGCGSQHVRQKFPNEVAACRARHASTLLIVVTDADNLTVAQREQTLHQVLLQEQMHAVGNEPIVILIPKWQVETWVRCLNGDEVQEDDEDTDKPPVTPQSVKSAAHTLYDWSRPNAQIGPNCVDSLRASLPHWYRIG